MDRSTTAPVFVQRKEEKRRIEKESHCNRGAEAAGGEARHVMCMFELNRTRCWKRSGLVGCGRVLSKKETPKTT